MAMDDLKVVVANLATELREAGAASNRDLPNAIRKRFIAVRAELFQRGIFDPLLARFDSATVPQASPAEIAEELRLLASNL